MNIFNSLHRLLADRNSHNRDLRLWANTEYKFDSDYAYTVMRETGKIPQVGEEA
jgi:hypothetical protein